MARIASACRPWPAAAVLIGLVALSPFGAAAVEAPSRALTVMFTTDVGNVVAPYG